MGEHATWRASRIPAERLPTIEMTRALAMRNPMVALLEIDVTEPRSRIAKAAERTGERLSFSAFVVSCVARAVQEHPEVHAMRRGRRLFVCDRVDVATLIEVDGRELRVPVVHVLRDAAGRSLDDLHREIRRVQSDGAADLGTVRRRVRLVGLVPKPLRWIGWRILARSPKRWQRLAGTVAVSPVGMFGGGRAWGMGVASFPVSVTIGGIARVAEQSPVEVLCVTVVLDHDVVDGAPAARFVATLRRFLEGGAGLEVVDEAVDLDRSSSATELSAIRSQEGSSGGA